MRNKESIELRERAEIKCLQAVGETNIDRADRLWAEAQGLILQAHRLEGYDDRGALSAKASPPGHASRASRERIRLRA